MGLHPSAEIVIHYVPLKHRLGAHSTRKPDLDVSGLGGTKGSHQEQGQERSREAGAHVPIVAPYAFNQRSGSLGRSAPSSSGTERLSNRLTTRIIVTCPALQDAVIL